jgi:S-formylglutathione hydrolase FrmB
MSPQPSREPGHAPSREASTPGAFVNPFGGHEWVGDAEGGFAVIHLRDLGDEPLSSLPLVCGRLAEANLPAISLGGAATWWLDRPLLPVEPSLTPEQFVVELVTAEVTRRLGVAPPRIALFGSGSGGQAALRIAYRHPDRFPVAAAIDPAIDFHRTMNSGDAGSDTLWQIYGDPEAARQDTAILHIHPLNWPRQQAFFAHARSAWFDGAERLHSKLIALGIPHESRLARGDQADWPAEAATAAVAFLAEALAREARRCRH